MTSAHVTKILFDGDKATGVRYQRHGRTTDAFAGREVIIAAGAIQSPQILELSGIGDAKRLQDLGITIHRPPRDGHMAFIKSPDGISIELLQSGDALPPSEPWLSMPNTGSW